MRECSLYWRTHKATYALLFTHKKCQNISNISFVTKSSPGSWALLVVTSQLYCQSNDVYKSRKKPFHFFIKLAIQ